MIAVDPAHLPVYAARARREVVRMIEAGGSGHLGGALSCIDIVTALYGCVLRVDPAHPDDHNRDRFLLSAGHKALAQYAVLSVFGFFPDETLDTYGTYRSPVPGHPDMAKLVGIEANTGALGHGAAIAAGMAFAARLDGRDERTVVVLGDGELAEGSNWEAFAATAHHRLGGLTAVIDCNGMQISGETSDIMGLGPVADKLSAFGWRVLEIDGHDFGQILDAFAEAPAPVGRPTAVVAKTVKGQGISTLAGTLGSHYWTPSADELRAAIEELDDSVLAAASVAADERTVA